MAASTNLTLMQMNDSHAYLELHQERFWNGDHAEYRKVGGYARIATILNRARQERPGQVLAFDCGDTIHGTYAAVKSRGEALVPVLNALGLDGMTAHWEFAYGPEQFKKLAGRLTYPMLASNIYDQASQELVFPPYAVCDVAGVRLGVIGIAATIVDKGMPASFSKGLYFTLGKDELPGHILKLRNDEKVDLVLVISHLGFPQDVKLAGEVQGIDVLLSGHTHHRLYQPVRVGNTILIQSGSQGSFIGWLDLVVQDRHVVDYKHELIVVEESIQPDQAVQALIDEALRPSREELSQVVGRTATALNRNTILEATMDNLLLQSLVDLTGAAVAFSNGWRYGAPIVPGPVTVNDLWNIIPVDPPVSLVKLTGEEIRTMLEENLERTFASDPYRQMGGYVKRVWGLNVYIKIENPRGHRIQELYAQGRPVKPDQIFSGAFVTAQGVPEKYGSDRQALDIHAIDALRRYLKRKSPVEAELRGSVVAV